MSEQAQTTEQEPSPLKQELAELLSYVRQQTQDGVESGKAFVAKEAPQVAREIVAREIADASMGLTFAVALAVTAVVGRAKFWKAYKEAQKGEGHYSDAGEGFAAGAIITPIVAGAGAAVLGSCALTRLIHALVAPRMVILDYIRHLI